MLFGRKKNIVPVRTGGELDAMAAAGAVAGRVLVAVRAVAESGLSTLELAEVAEHVIHDAGAVSAFKGYMGFPASICVSVNDGAVNGLPASDQVLADGDLVSVNCGVILEGWYGKAGCTFGIGMLSQADEQLIEATRMALDGGIAAMVPGNRLTSVSHAIEMGTRAAERKHGRTYGIVEDYGGHGIGREMHTAPFLPNEGAPGKGPRLVVGSVLAIHPVLTLGTTQTRVLEDDWTVVTLDGSKSALWQHTVAVTADGPRILPPWPL